MRQVTSRAAKAAAPALLLFTMLGEAHASDLCASIHELVGLSQASFVEIMETPSGDAGDHNVTQALADSSSCLVTKRSAKAWYQCGWEYPLRAEEAYDTYDAFAGRLDDCLGQEATVHSDRSVNHPDFYALRRYELAQADVSVSVKDKGALGKTFVFIKVQGTK